MGKENKLTVLIEQLRIREVFDKEDVTSKTFGDLFEEILERHQSRMMDYIKKETSNLMVDKNRLGRGKWYFVDEVGEKQVILNDDLVEDRIDAGVTEVALFITPIGG